MKPTLYLRFRLLALLLFGGMPLLHAATYHVSPTGNNANSGTMASPFLTIQHAVNVANAGDVIQIAAGSYTEQVIISKSLELVGANRTTTFIKAPATVPSVVTSNGNSAQPIVFVSGTGTTTILRRLTISGNGGRDLPNFFGVFYDQASGTLKNARITEIRWSTFNGVQSGLAFAASHVYDANQTQTITVDDNLIDDFQKNGISVGEPGTVATIIDNTVTGAGAASVGVIAQNGIQVGFGAQADIRRNTIQAHLYNTAQHPNNEFESAGVLVYDAQASIGNVFSNNENGILAYEDSGFPYTMAVTYGGTNTFSNNAVHITNSSGVAPSGGTRNYDKRVDNPAQPGNVFGSLGYAGYYASAGNTLNASAGTFAEDVIVTKALSLRGNNYGINPNTGSRNPETILVPATNDADNSIILYLQGNLSGIDVDGFTFDGDNPALSGGVAMNGADVNAAEAIAAYDGIAATKIKNNIQHR